MKEYQHIVSKILSDGAQKPNRTGIGSYMVPGLKFQHDMSKGFPLLTTKKMPYHLIVSELEFFIKGVTDKRWLQFRGNHIWDEWCNPEIVPYGHDEETRERMIDERDLGPVYGFQWRYFGAEYKGCDEDYNGEGVDQLANLVDMLKENPHDRRMVVSSWNPVQQHQMAIPPCHYSFQVVTSEDRLNLLWNQRSVDTMLGLPFNIASYATLLHLLSKEAGLEEGTLSGFLGDVHIYENHVEGAEEQVKREPFNLPKIKTENFTSIFDWEYTDTELVGYEHHPLLKFDIAV